MPKKRYQSFFRTPLPLAKITGSAHDTTIKPTVLDAHAHLCLLASEEEKVNLGFWDGVADQFYIANWWVFMQTHERETAQGRITEGGGRQGVRTPPPPLKITKNRVSKHTSPVPLKITKLPSQHSMLGHQSAKRQFNGVSLAGQWWPAFVVFGSSLPSSMKKNVVKVGPPPSLGQNFLAG